MAKIKLAKSAGDAAQPQAKAVECGTRWGGLAIPFTVSQHLRRQ
jgi:hypothetical protein